MKIRNRIAIFNFIFATTLVAAPSIYVKNSDLRSIKTPRSSAALVADAGDASRVWVLPPHSGKVALTDVFVSANAGFCKTTKSLLERTSGREERRKELAARVENFKKEMGRLKAKHEDAKKIVAELLQNPSLKAIVDLEAKIDRLKKELDKLYQDLEEAETVEEMEAIEAKIRLKREEVGQAETQLGDLRKKHSKAYREYELAKNDVDIAKIDYDRAVDDYNSAKDSLEDAAKQIRRLFDMYAKISGATAGFSFDSGWEKETQRLQDKHSQMSFSQIPTYNARMSLALTPTVKSGRLYTDLPMLVGYGTFGYDLFYGERLAPDSPYRDRTGMQSQVNMNLSVNMLGICPVVMEDFFEGQEYDVQRDAEGKPVFGLTTTYEYDVVAPFDMDVSYNLWRIFELVISESPFYGYIKQDSIASLAKKEWAKELLTISGGNAAPMGERSQMIEEIKSELINRVLTTVAKPSQADVARTVDIGLPPVEGSFALAYGQNTSCGTNVFCQSSQWVVRIGKTVWGQKPGGAQTLMKRFKKDWDKTLSERWSLNSPTPRQGISTIALIPKPPINNAIVDKAYESYQQLTTVTLPTGLDDEERALLYGFHTVDNFSQDVLAETGLRPLIGGIFSDDGVGVRVKSIASKDQFRRLVFPESAQSRSLPLTFAEVSVNAKVGDMGSWASLQQLDDHIAAENYIERANAGTLSPNELNDFATLLQQRDAIRLAAIDRKLSALEEALR